MAVARNEDDEGTAGGTAEGTSRQPEETGEPGETGEPEEMEATAAVPEQKQPEQEPGKQPEQKPPGRARRRIAVAIGVFGELLITAGVVLGLFVAYSLWWTNVLADREAKARGESVRRHWQESKGNEDRGPGALDTKGGIGFLHVPAMSDKETLVTKGTDPEELNKGVAGYYEKPVKSAMPQDESGNFALAAHRDGHGAKFHNIDKIEKGDPLVFETKDTWYVYKVFETLPQTSKYNVDVIDPVPGDSGKKEKGRYITLTTCTPVLTSDYRYIVWGELERTEKVDADRTPPEELR